MLVPAAFDSRTRVRDGSRATDRDGEEPNVELDEDGRDGSGGAKPRARQRTRSGASPRPGMMTERPAGGSGSTLGGRLHESRGATVASCGEGTKHSYTQGETIEFAQQYFE